MVCQILNHHLDSTKMPYNIKLKVQNNIAEVNVANQSLGFSNSNIIDIQLHKVKLFDTISPKQMAECQKRDTQLAHVYEYVATNSKPKLTVIYHVKLRPVHRLLLQYDWLSLIRASCITYLPGRWWDQQIILPQCLCNQVLKSLNNDHGHQGLQCVTDLLCSRVYWPTMFADAITGCSVWKVSCFQGDYNEPKTVRVVW